MQIWNRGNTFAFSNSELWPIDETRSFLAAAPKSFPEIFKFATVDKMVCMIGKMQKIAFQSFYKVESELVWFLGKRGWCNHYERRSQSADKDF